MDHLSKTELDYSSGCELGTENLKVRERFQRNRTLGLIRFIGRNFHVPNVIHKLSFIIILTRTDEVQYSSHAKVTKLMESAVKTKYTKTFKSRKRKRKLQNNTI